MGRQLSQIASQAVRLRPHRVHLRQSQQVLDRALRIRTSSTERALDRPWQGSLIIINDR